MAEPPVCAHFFLEWVKTQLRKRSRMYKKVILFTMNYSEYTLTAYISETSSPLRATYIFPLITQSRLLIIIGNKLFNRWFLGFFQHDHFTDN